MYKRFKWNPEVRLDCLAFNSNTIIRLHNARPGIRIFIGSTMELFGNWVRPEWMRWIIDSCSNWPQHNFIFLTKQPQNLIEWSPFPSNCWVGVSVTANGDMSNAYYGLRDIQAGKRFISFEPLLGQIGRDELKWMKNIISWVIIGSRTQPVKHPPIEWVTEIITAADYADIPVFVKEPMAKHHGIPRQ
jgi:protein gp37